MRTGGPDLPATMGMYRPTLATVLIEKAKAVGAKIRFDTTYTELRSNAAALTWSPPTPRRLAATW